MVYGAIIGDLIGSRFEFDRPNWTRDFDLFTEENKYTDDTYMTLAIAEALIETKLLSEDRFKNAVIDWMRIFGRMFPNAGYGANFVHWFDNPVPYGSFGNGSAMRVSAIGWVFDKLEKTREVARWSAEVSHNHPEGIKGAECVASVIWLARHGKSKRSIMKYVESEFGYDITTSVDEYIENHRHDESCMDSLPKALAAFREGRNFEEIIRNAVAMGGDTDTIAAIAGSMAEARYEIPKDIRRRAEQYMPSKMERYVSKLEDQLCKFHKAR